MKIMISHGTDYTPAYKKFLRGVVYSFGFPIRIITTPIIDAGGKSAWDIMLRRTRIALQKQRDDVVLKDGTIKISFAPPNGSLSILMDALSDLYKENNKYYFTLIGHSLGPVMLNELIRQYPDLPYRNIVYMGAACTIRDAGYALNPYMLNHTNTTFYNLCLHENADKYSTMWYAGIPRGSILEWIDTFLGDPLTSDDLTLGKWSNSLRVLHSINPEFRRHTVIKSFGINDPETNTILIDQPETHTDFSDPKLRFWEPSFWQVKPLIQNKK
jgi:pimeloyl-ACP methyl ester carboxylesterase